jgi:hypothetical protein
MAQGLFDAIGSSGETPFTDCLPERYVSFGLLRRAAEPGVALTRLFVRYWKMDERLSDGSGDDRLSIVKGQRSGAGDREDAADVFHIEQRCT